jgi:hypothetical protein
MKVVLTLTGLFQNNLWKCKTDYASYCFFRDILNDLVNCFPIGLEEAIKLINSKFKSEETLVEGNIFYHEISLVIAAYFYWGPHGELESQKPMKENCQTKYELFLSKIPFESDYVEDYIYIDSKIVSSYQEKGIINENYIKTFEVSVLNYEQALCELSKHRGEKYFKEPIFEGYY